MVVLRNGNPSGDFLDAPRCGARTRRGTACQCPAIRGRCRCRLHGGRSTGPRTLKGRKRSRAAVLKHGRYSVIEREVQASFQEMSESMRQLAASTRDRFFRELYTQVAEPRTDARRARQVRTPSSSTESVSEPVTGHCVGGRSANVWKQLPCAVAVVAIDFVS